MARIVDNVWQGTSAEFDMLPPEQKNSFASVQVRNDWPWLTAQEPLKYLDKHGMETMADIIKFGRKKIWHGTAAEWEALPEAMKQQYDQAEVIDDAEIIGGGSGSSDADLAQLSARIDGIENKANANTSAITVERQERVAKDTEQDSHINTAQSNIAQLQLKVTSLENKTDNDTVYDDTALKARVATLEAAIENLGNGSSSAVYDSGWLTVKLRKGYDPEYNTDTNILSFKNVLRIMAGDLYKWLPSSTTFLNATDAYYRRKGNIVTIIVTAELPYNINDILSGDLEFWLDDIKAQLQHNSQGTTFDPIRLGNGIFPKGFAPKAGVNIDVHNSSISGAHLAAPYANGCFCDISVRSYILYGGINTNVKVYYKIPKSSFIYTYRYYDSTSNTIKTNSITSSFNFVVQYEASDELPD